MINIWLDPDIDRTHAHQQLACSSIKLETKIKIFYLELSVWDMKAVHLIANVVNIQRQPNHPISEHSWLDTNRVLAKILEDSTVHIRIQSPSQRHVRMGLYKLSSTLKWLSFEISVFRLIGKLRLINQIMLERFLFSSK